MSVNLRCGVVYKLWNGGVSIRCLEKIHLWIFPFIGIDIQDLAEFYVENVKTKMHFHSINQTSIKSTHQLLNDPVASAK